MLTNMVSDSGLVRTVADGVGFPSSHSTNSVSIALYFAQWMLEERVAMGPTALVGGLACLSFLHSA
jgi:membrane-associated phospholipid phosphatase